MTRKRPKTVVKVGPRGGLITRPAIRPGQKHEYLSKRNLFQVELLAESQKADRRVQGGKRRQSQKCQTQTPPEKQSAIGEESYAVSSAWAKLTLPMPPEMRDDLRKGRDFFPLAETERPSPNPPRNWPGSIEEFHEVYADMGRLAIVSFREYAYVVSSTKQAYACAGERDYIPVKAFQLPPDYVLHIHPSASVTSFSLSVTDVAFARKHACTIECISCLGYGPDFMASMRYDPKLDIYGKDAVLYEPSARWVPEYAECLAKAANALRLALTLPSFTICGGDKILRALIEHGKAKMPWEEVRKILETEIMTISFWLDLRDETAPRLKTRNETTAQVLRSFGFTVELV